MWKEAPVIKELHKLLLMLTSRDDSLPSLCEDLNRHVLPCGSDLLDVALAKIKRERVGVEPVFVQRQDEDPDEKLKCDIEWCQYRSTA